MSEQIRGQFEAATDFVRNGGLESASVGADEARQLSLSLYGFFKQANSGKCNVPQPSYFDFIGRKKWQAWNDLGDMSEEQAMTKYIDIVAKRSPVFAKTIHPEASSSSQQLTTSAGGSQSIEISGPDDVHAAYFITGVTGFIGMRLARVLLERNEKAKVYALIRETPEAAALMFQNKLGSKLAARVVAVRGDITKPDFGLSASDKQRIKAEATNFYHLAALYDLNADAALNEALNVTGTTNAVNFANFLGVGFHYVSSIVVAGDYKGTFYETMFDEGQNHHEPYYKTKFIAEGLVRQNSKVPTRIYRPGIVIGSTVDGIADKIDGPYYLFKVIQQIRKYALEWFVFPLFRGEEMPLVPVDYVVNAMDRISHRKESAGKTYHLVDPEPYTFIDVLNIFSKAAHAPTYSSRVIDLALGFLPDIVKSLDSKFPNIYKMPFEVFSKFAGIPTGAMRYIFNATYYDNTETDSLLKKTNSGVECPDLKTYAYKIWDHWERHMDPALDRAGSMSRGVRGKNVVVTGGHTGIGRAIVDKLLGYGAGKVIIIGRDVEAMAQVQREAEAAGHVGKLFFYRCDLAAEADATSLPPQVIKDHSRVDILINNAGRSIRRSVAFQYDRLHDFRRTVDLNYFGSLAMMLGFLPGMRENKYGQIINISSIGAQTNQPRFSAYAASKAALDTFSRCINSEITQDNVICSTIYMPLVKTKMIAPTAKSRSQGVNYYNRVAITPEQAADMALKPIVTKARTVATTLGNILQVLYWFSPALVDQIFSVVYKLEPENVPEGKISTTDAELAKESIALLHMSRELMR